MRYKKTKLVALMLALATLGPLTACQKQEAVLPNDTYYAQAGTNQSETRVETQPSGTVENYTLADIKPKFSPYQQNLQMDEESVLKIIRVAMADAQKFYTNMGAPNMTYDKNLQIVQGKDNFYPEWMNEYFYLARAMSESSRRIDVVTPIPNSEKSDYAHGMMQIRPESIKKTLAQYYRNIFGVEVDLDDLCVVPSQDDVSAAVYSKEAQQNIVQAVYNNIYLSICFDIYNVKCLNPISHQDYYAAYGGYKEDVRKLAATTIYTAERGFIISGLQAGNLREKFVNYSNHYKNYLNNMEKYQSDYENKYESENQPGAN